MLTPAAKRRRAEAASATLSRPFRSPAVRGKPAGTAPSTPSGLLAKEAKETTDTRDTTDATGSTVQSYKRPRQLSVSGVLPASQNKRPSKRSLPSAPASLDSLVDQFALELDAGDALVKQLSQSRPLENENKRNKTDNMYAELPALTTKWRDAGRLAAEEVFEFVSQRIAGAGGIKAWRANAAAPLQDDSEDEDQDKNDDDDEDDEGEQARRERERAEEEAREAQERAEAETSQNFTMATMLASLGVEPELLDYDEAEERWRD